MPKNRATSKPRCVSGWKVEGTEKFFPRARGVVILGTAAAPTGTPPSHRRRPTRPLGQDSLKSVLAVKRLGHSPSDRDSYQEPDCRSHQDG
jgi:hypothetical protein